MERQFLLAVPFNFPVMLLVPQRSALFLTSLSTFLHCQPLIWWLLILGFSILLKKKELGMEEYILVMLEVNIIEG